MWLFCRVMFYLVCLHSHPMYFYTSLTWTYPTESKVMIENNYFSLQVLEKMSCLLLCLVLLLGKVRLKDDWYEMLISSKKSG